MEKSRKKDLLRKIEIAILVIAVAIIAATYFLAEKSEEEKYFSAKYSTSSVANVKNHYKLTLEYDNLHANYILNNVGVIARTEISISSDELNAEYEGYIKGTHVDGDVSKVYNMEMNLTGTKNNKIDNTFVYYDGEYEYISRRDGEHQDKTKTACKYSTDTKIDVISKWFAELSYGTINNATLGTIFEKENVTYSMNQSDKEFTRIKVSYIVSEDFDGNGLKTDNAASVREKKITTTNTQYLYNTDYELVGVYTEIEVLTKRFDTNLDGFKDKERATIKYFAVPWEGNVSFPSDLNIYKAV